MLKKLTLFTIFLFLLACDEKAQAPKKVPSKSDLSIESPAEIKKILTETSTSPKGHLPVPLELQKQTENELNLNPQSAEKLADTLEKEIKE